jgi:cobalt-zinc-cadmium efflux system outer membrane protein
VPHFLLSRHVARLSSGALAVLVLLVPFVAIPARAQPPTARPLTLRSLIESVVTRHPSLEAAQSLVRAARGSRRTAGAFGNPVLAYQLENAPLPNRAAPSMDREAMTTAMFPLEPVFQRAPRVRAADANTRAADADARAMRQRLVMEAATAYYRTALAQVRVDITTDLVHWLDTLVSYNRVRAEEGVIAEADWLRATLERDRTVAEGALHDVELASARAELRRFLGGDSQLGAPLVVAGDSLPLPLPTFGVTLATSVLSSGADTTRALALTRALGTRPEMIGARERVAAAAAGISAERSMLLRELSAMLGTKRSAGTTSLVAGLSLPLPLFDRNRGEVDRATAERAAAVFESAVQERAIRADVEAAYASARILSARVSALASRDAASGRPVQGTGIALLDLAEESRRIALAAYREGAVPLLQVLDAARARGEARLAFFEVLYAQHASVLALFTAEGRDVVAWLSTTGDNALVGASLDTLTPARMPER